MNDGLTIIHSAGEWWIQDPADPEPIGPYNTKAEAESDLAGIRRFNRYGHLREFWTCEKGERSEKGPNSRTTVPVKTMAGYTA